MHLNLDIPSEAKYIVYSTTGVLYDKLELRIDTKMALIEGFIFENKPYISLNDHNCLLSKIKCNIIDIMRKIREPFMLNHHRIHIYKSYGYEGVYATVVIPKEIYCAYTGFA